MTCTAEARIAAALNIHAPKDFLRPSGRTVQLCTIDLQRHNPLRNPQSPRRDRRMRREPPYSPGDHVRRTGIDYENEGMYQGEEYVVSTCDRRGNLKVRGIDRWYHANHFTSIRKAGA